MKQLLILSGKGGTGKTTIAAAFIRLSEAHTKLAVCINKYDINLENSEKIELFCRENGLPLVGKVPFDPNAVLAVNQGKTIADIDCTSGRAVRAVYDQVKEILFGQGGRKL